MLLQIYQSSFFESESQHQIILLNAPLRCCKYIKVPFLKANHNKRKSIKMCNKLLQIYQSSFFESESQHRNEYLKISVSCCKYIKVPFLKANHNKKYCNMEGIKLLQIYQSSFFESESQQEILQYGRYKVVANISKFLFWKRITTLCLRWIQ